MPAWPRLSRTPFFRDGIHPQVCIFVEKDSCCCVSRSHKTWGVLLRHRGSGISDGQGLSSTGTHTYHARITWVIRLSTDLSSPCSLNACCYSKLGNTTNKAEIEASSLLSQTPRRLFALTLDSVYSGALVAGGVYWRKINIKRFFFHVTLHCRYIRNVFVTSKGRIRRRWVEE